MIWSVKAEAETDPNHGCLPSKRPIKDYIYNGIVNLDKPSGPTSTTVSDWVKKILKVQKAGHSGTLDPKVTGVLVVPLDNATKIIPTLLPAPKTYVGTARFHKDIPLNEIESLFRQFKGTIYQKPPLRSAVVRKLRKRTIYSIEILEKDGQDVLYQVKCEAGTYIRKLCLTGNTEIILSSGEVKKMQELNDLKEVYTSAISLQDYALKKAKIIAIQKLPSPKKLIEVKTEAGIPIRLTPDHPILIDTKEGPKFIEAENLKKNNMVFSPRTLPIKENIPYIIDILDDDVLIYDKNIRERVKKELIKKYGSIREASRKLHIDRKPYISESNTGLKIKHIKKFGLWGQLKLTIAEIKSPRGNIIKLRDKKLTEDHLYLCGLIASDGCIVSEKRCKHLSRLKFHNTNKALIQKFVDTHRKSFPDIPIHTKQQRVGLFEVDVYNTILAEIADYLGIRSPDSKSDLNTILRLPKDLIAAFLRGYFDGDGTVYIKRKKDGHGFYSNIRFCSSNFTSAKRIYQMLKRLGIRSKIYEKPSIGVFNRKNYGKFYLVSLVTPYDKLLFVQKIDAAHPLKKRKLIKLKNSLSRFSKNSELDYVTQSTIPFIKDIKSKYNIKLPRNSNIHRLLTYQRIPTRGAITKIMNSIQGKISISEKRALRSMINPDLYTERILSVKSVTPRKDEKFVYDVTIKKHHNFIPEAALVVSNCHDIGTISCGAHMTELRRKAAAGFDESTLVTLQQLSEAQYLFSEKGDESLLRKYIQPIETAVQNIPKIVVLDTTIESICHGAPLNVPGISKYQSFKKGDTVAILSLKGELISLAKAEMDSAKLKKAVKGTLAKSTRVIMEAGTYPRNPK